MRSLNANYIQVLRVIMREISTNLEPDAFLFLYSLKQFNKDAYERLLVVIRKYVNATRASVLSVDVIRRLYERHVKSKRVEISQKEERTEVTIQQKEVIKKVETKATKGLLSFLHVSAQVTPKISSTAKREKMTKKTLLQEVIPMEKQLRKIEEKKPITKTKEKILDKVSLIKKLYLPEENLIQKIKELEKEVCRDISDLIMSKEEVSSPKEEEMIELKILQTIRPYTVIDSEESFYSLLLSRYNTLRSVIASRGIRAINISELNSITDSAYVIVMPREKRKTKKADGLIVVADDPTGDITIYIPLSGDLEKKAKRLLLDSVVAFKIRKGNNFYVAEDIIFPDVNINRKRHRARKPIKAIFIADIHVGSKVFLEDYFRNFIKFISGKISDPKLKRISREIKYIFILGDLVDGVGVYPNHENELAIPNIYEQYRILGDFLDEIPNDKNVVIIPGNHDASTRLLPQPPIPDAFAKPLYKLEHVYLLGNPSYVSVDGVRILLYHGYGVEKIAQQLQFDLDRPTKVMIEMMRNRHLLPTWGAAPMAPVPEDPLVIKEVPDIFAMAHVHRYDLRMMKGGVLLITTGSFQGLTTWQKQLGIEPTPGIGIIVNLQTFDVSLLQATDKVVQVIGM